MRLYFKNRNSPKAYKVVITALDTSHIGFIGEITNPTMKIGNGVVQFYLAPIASKGTWTINEDYHFKDGKLTLMAYKNLAHTSYNSHTTYTDFTKNIQLALELTEFHGFEIIGIVVKEITSLSDASWMYDAENKKILYYNSNTSGSLTLNQVASGINTSLISQNSTTKNKAELFVKDVIKDLFRTQPKGLLKASEFNSTFITNAVLTVLGTNIYSDTDVNKYTTSSLNFSQGLIDRIPDVVWNTEGNATVVSGGEAFSHTALQTTGVLGDSLKTSSNLLTGGQTPFEVSFDVLIREDQIKANEWPYLALFSKSTNTSFGDQTLYIRVDKGNKLCFIRAQNAGGNVIQEIVGKTNIDFNTKYTVKILYNGNMFKCFVNDNLDFQFGTTVGWFVGGDQPYRFLDNFVPSYPLIGNRGFTNGMIDNIQVNDNYFTDPTEKVNPYKDSLICKLDFQGQANKTNFVDQANNSVTWIGYGDAKLEVENTRINYSYLKLNGLASYLSVNNANHFAFTGSKFSIRVVFKTSLTTRGQALFDRYESGKKGCYNISLSTSGQVVFYYVPSTSYATFLSTATNLNDGNKHSIDVIKDGTNILIYVDDLLDSIHDATGITFDYLIEKTSIGAQIQTRNEAYDFNGQIYSLTVYKDEAVYPEIVPKVLNVSELDFDRGNLEDKYNNVVWNNNGGGVSFIDQGSINGLSALLPSSSNIRTGPSSLLNFENKNFLISMDALYTATNSASVLLMSGSNTDYQEISFGRTGGSIGLWCNNSTTSNKTSLSANILSMPNTLYNIKVLRNNNVLNILANDIVVAQRPIDSTVSYDYNNSVSTTIGGPYNSNSSFNFIGKLDNVKFVKDYQDDLTIRKPFIHLPLKTNITNLGVADLVINNNGSASFTTIDDKKCIYFQQGKYLSFNNSLLNLGSNTDFYIELDVNLLSFLTYNMLLTNSTAWTTGSQSFWITNQGKVWIQDYNGTMYSSSTNIILNTWNKIIFSRKNNTITIDVNDSKDSFESSLNLNFNNCFIGCSGWAINYDRLDGYMSNLKIFVGTSTLPSTYDPKKVIDVDFSPVWNKDGTRKAYLFEDKYKNCVLQANSFTHRNYENGKYGATFDGTTQFIQLGRNELFNFGRENFVIKIRFSVKDFTNTWQRLLSDNQYNNGNRNYIMVTGDDYSVTDKKHRLFFGLDDNSTSYMFSSTTLLPNTEYVMEVVRDGDNFTMYLNDVIEAEMVSTLDCNFNLNGSTFIGAANRTDALQSSQDKQIFKGVVYSVRVLRNTSDLSLLNDVLPEPESPEDGNDTGIPPLEKGVLNFWQLRQDVDPHNLVLEFNQLRLE